MSERILELHELPQHMQSVITAQQHYSRILPQNVVIELPLLRVADGFLAREHLAAVLPVGWHYSRNALRQLVDKAELDALGVWLAERCELTKEDWLMLQSACTVGGERTLRALLARVEHDPPRELAWSLQQFLEDGYPVDILIPLCRFRSLMARGYDRNMVDKVIEEFAKRAGVRTEEIADYAAPDHLAAGSAEWKNAVKQQKARLKEAWISGRRWRSDLFLERVIGSLTVAPLARQLVWGLGEVQSRGFQIAADGRLLDARGAVVELPVEGVVGIVHRANLEAEEVAHWQAAIAKPFFDQWAGKEAPKFASDSATEVTPLPQAAVPAARLLSTLEGRGWKRIVNAGRQSVRLHAKPFPELNIVAVATYTGIALAYGSEWEEQQLERCVFQAHDLSRRVEEHGPTLLLADVDPMAISEVMEDFRALETAR